MKHPKSIIFFDGDGTLWYPRTTKRRTAPHWIYQDNACKGNYLEHMILIPGTVSALKKLKAKNIITVLLSTHPVGDEAAKASLLRTATYFKIDKYFDEIHATLPMHKSKGIFMERILQERRLHKNRALMIGDNYFYDYQSARKVGIEGALIRSSYMYTPINGRLRNVFSDLKSILDVAI